MDRHRPPRLARALLSLLVPRELWGPVDGDLTERYARLCRDRGRARARAWYWGQLLRSRPLAMHRAVRELPGHRARREGAPVIGLGRDVALALRGLRIRPGVALTIIATVGVAVGATTSVFTVVNGVLLRPLDYPAPDRLVRVWQTRASWTEHAMVARRAMADRYPVSVPTFEDWKAARTSLESLGLFGGHMWTHQTPSGAEALSGAVLSSGVFQALGVEAHLGRRILPEDDRPGASPVAVLSFGLWRDHFGSDPGVLGDALTLSGTPHTIVGVMPAGFHLPARRSDLWTSLPEHVKSSARDSYSYNVLGRLRPGSDVRSAQADLASVQARLARTYPDVQGDFGVRVESVLDSVVSDVRPTLLFLLAAVGLVLLVACVNIANVLSVVGLSRSRELAVRVALGAGRGRLVRSMLVEAAVLVALGGVGGIVLAWTSMPGLHRYLPPGLPRREVVGMDPTVMAFGLALTGLTAFLVGVFPALQARRTSPREVMAAGARSLAGGTFGRRLRSGLVMVEVAFAFLLLVGAGLLATSYERLWSSERGFRPDGLLVMYIYPDRGQYPGPEDRARFVTELRASLAGLPGVQVTAANHVPLGGSFSSTSYLVEGAEGVLEPASVVISAVLDNYFDVMDIPITRGRGFTVADVADSPPVAVVNEALARRYWPDGPAVGARLRRTPDDPWLTVVGVAGDVRHRSLAETLDPELYLPAVQTGRTLAEWVLRVDGNAPEALTAARAALARLSPSTPLRRPQILEESIRASVAVPRFRTALVLALAGIATVLALLGLYGVVAWTVSQRRREFALRLAIGGEPRGILALTLVSGLRLYAGGATAGVILAALAARFVAPFLYRVEPTHPVVYGLTALGVAGVTAAASWLPARSASRVEPMAILKSE